MEKPKYMDVKRLLASSPANISSWFSLLEETLKTKKISQDLILNIDETGISLCKSDNNHIITDSDQKQSVLHSQQHEPNATLIFGVYTDGSSLNPLMLWPSKTVPKDLLPLKFRNVEIITNGSGWITKTDYEEIMMQYILPAIDKKRIELHGKEATALIIMDGHSSRLCWPVMSWCCTHSIEIAILPSHSTHLTQPLDRYVFARFKKSLYSSFKPPTESGVSASRKALIPALADAVSAALDPRTIRKSSYACGIEPFDPSVVLDRLPNQLSIAKTSSLTSSCTFSEIMNKKVITSDEFVEENDTHEEGLYNLNG
ncbi:uncharacterized protein MONOS_6284 [Monocercomonoides exilis]|uniref:uncharacterized protein n=1 Tax=Monocercomonoides exilis TaxID=2049356 RepID=UPI00355A8FBA|nr:hypothetical protein MONOS_6284 [Monocercomonoides exilis]|eukprot:MONOS_6284.1-p1 / transcript=MONOS_6284.1 / gene=MONOS_6284 / organism=Monocercomonoides_exilis_PA203 / gene_product=unspecified product / transcript_product=unspecified product / location=Mono_scaffold00195:94453-95394(-) / protein_length=313 / sequence_SO=supercontig / SO=protein_coding / is_pseudo=false